jgi:hypothetical protein
MLTFLYHSHMVLASGSARSVKEILRKPTKGTIRMAETYSLEDRLAYATMELVRVVRDDDVYCNARLATHRQVRAKALVQQVATRWDLTSVELAQAGLSALGDVTGIRTVEEARTATYQEESERRRERLEDNERMATIRATPDVVAI